MTVIPALLFSLGGLSCASTDEADTTQAQSISVAPPQFRTPSKGEIRRVRAIQEKKKQSADNMTRDSVH